MSEKMSPLQLMFLTSVAVVGLTVVTIMSSFTKESPFRHLSSVDKPASHKGTSLHVQTPLTVIKPKSPSMVQLTQKTAGLQRRSLKTNEETSKELRYLPFPATTLSSSVILQQPWVDNLKQILSHVHSAT